MSKQEMLSNGLYNALALLLGQAQQVALVRNKQMAPSLKVSSMPMADLQQVLDCCAIVHEHFNRLTETLGKLLLERAAMPLAECLVDDEELVRFAGLLNGMAGSLNTELSALKEAATALKSLY